MQEVTEFMSVLTTKEIMDIIPHRHPFLLVDTIEELVPGVRAAGKMCRHMMSIISVDTSTGAGDAGSADH